MNIQRMHSEVKLRYNNINSNQKRGFPTAFIDDYINDAQEEFLNICYSGNNTKKFRLGFEVTQQRIDMLSTLVVPEEQASVTVFKTNVYKINLSNLAYKYRHLIRLYVNTSCGKIDCISVRHDEIDDHLRNENTKPSAIWRRCLFVQANDSSNNQCIYLYTGGQFTITNAIISYVKEPKKVFFGTYDTFEYINGDTTAPKIGDVPINSEFPTLSHPFIVEITVQLMARSLEDPNMIQITEDKITRTI